MKREIKNSLVALISAGFLFNISNELRSETTNNIYNQITTKYDLEKNNTEPESKTLSYDLNWQRTINSYINNYPLSSPFLINLATKYNFSLKNIFNLPLTGNLISQGSMYSNVSREDYHFNLNCNLAWDGPISLSARSGQYMLLNSSKKWEDLVLTASKNLYLGKIDECKFNSNPYISTYWYNNSEENYSNWKNVSTGLNFIVKKGQLSFITSYNYLLDLNTIDPKENQSLSFNINYKF